LNLSNEVYGNTLCIFSSDRIVSIAPSVRNPVVNEQRMKPDFDTVHSASRTASGL